MGILFVCEMMFFTHKIMELDFRVREGDRVIKLQLSEVNFNNYNFIMQKLEQNCQISVILSNKDKKRFYKLSSYIHSNKYHKTMIFRFIDMFYFLLFILPYTFFHINITLLALILKSDELFFSINPQGDGFNELILKKK